MWSIAAGGVTIERHAVHVSVRIARGLVVACVLAVAIVAAAIYVPLLLGSDAAPESRPVPKVVPPSSATTQAEMLAHHFRAGEVHDLLMARGWQASTRASGKDGVYSEIWHLENPVDEAVVRDDLAAWVADELGWEPWQITIVELPESPFVETPGHAGD